MNHIPKNGFTDMLLNLSIIICLQRLAYHLEPAKGRGLENAVFQHSAKLKILTPLYELYGSD